MDIVNAHPATSGDMTACLISCMSSKDSNLSYHADDQSIIDQSSDICTVSFGPSRSLDFIWKSNNKQGRKGKPISPEFSVPATNHSINVMKAGYQSKILHRVPPGSEGGVRYSLGNLFLRLYHLRRTVQMYLLKMKIQVVLILATLPRRRK